MTMSQHDSYVKDISDQMKENFKQGKKVRIYHSTTNSTRAQNFKQGKFIDVSGLNDVLHVNTEEKYVLVEPNVPMDALVEATLKHQLIPPVVMEFPGITVGGGIQGGAGESSSFKWGAFHETFEEYEIVLGNGDVIDSSREKNSDLFHGTACSYGSLGIITRGKLSLIPAKEYVRVKYYRIHSFEEAVALIEKKSKEDVEFIDGIMFSNDLGVIFVGNQSEKVKLPIQPFQNARDEWFYLHAEKVVKKNSEYEELVPIRDYLFRYDRGGFWVGFYGFRGARIPFNRLTRAILNPIFKTRRLYGALHAGNFSQNFMIQDISFPKETVLEFMDWTHENLNIYPLWICPLKPEKEAKLSPTKIESNLVINIGVWGRLPNEVDFLKVNRDLEKTATRLEGKKILYAHAYYSREEFWTIYDYKWYMKLRTKYFAEKVFPDLYDKVHVSDTYTPSNKKSVLNFLRYSKKLPISKDSGTT
ncbi:MAG: FAD-binding oxidoreductase [Candidatus Hodarchaeales archaeon]|jgi:FAD/FMN-containing dehydrogenase